MGKLEKEFLVKNRSTKLQKAILQSVAVAGLLSVALLAPNALKILDLFENKDKKFLRNKKNSINQSRDRLVRAGLIAYNSEGYLRLTTKGEKMMRRIEASNFNLRKPKKWDKKWRILIFDISEKKKYLREKVRNTLVAVGLVRLQDSVWVYPYDCEDFITLLKADFKVGQDLLYIIADTIENDYDLKETFDLIKK